MVKGTLNTRPGFFQSKREPPSKAKEGRATNVSTTCPPLSSRNHLSSAATVMAKPEKQSLQAKIRSLPAQTAYPHLENVDSNIVASSSTSTPCDSPLKSKLLHTQSACNNLPLQGPSSTGTAEPFSKHSRILCRWHMTFKCGLICVSETEIL